MKAPSFAPGMILGEKYYILGVLGEGGSSTVYLVMDLRLRKRWALKRIYKLREAPAVYQAELDFLKTLNHPNLPRIVDCFSEYGSYCIVMDYVSGKALSQLRPSDGISADQLIRWAIETAEILEYLHSRTPPVIYQDLKPENLLVQKNGSVMLIDFGAGRNASDVRILTPEYAAPEQLERGKLTAQTDLYAFGRTYQRVASCCGGTGRQRFKKRQFLRILRKCTKKTPSERFASAEELKQALKRLEGGREHRSTALMLGMLLSGIAAILLTVSVLLPRGTKQERSAAQEAAAFDEEREAPESEKAASSAPSAQTTENERYLLRLRRAKRILLEGGETEIRSCMEKLIRTDPNEAEPYLLYISYLYEQGDLKRAAELYRQVSGLKHAKDHPSYRSITIKLQNAGAISDDSAERSEYEESE